MADETAKKETAPINKGSTADDIGAGVVGIMGIGTGIQQAVQDGRIVQTHNAVQDTKEELIRLAQASGVDASALEVKEDRTRGVLPDAGSFLTSHLPIADGLQEVSQNHQINGTHNEIAEMQRVAKEIAAKQGGNVDVSRLTAEHKEHGIGEDIQTFLGREALWGLVTSPIAAVQQGIQHHHIVQNEHNNAELNAVVAQLRTAAPAAAGETVDGVSGPGTERAEGPATAPDRGRG